MDRKKMNGVLYLVATPIGNFSDMTDRGREILSEVDIVAAEDTRRTGILLKHFNLKKKMESYHEHNQIGKGLHLLNLLLNGQNIALVTDAGTPCVSDPGTELVKICVENDINVVTIPGPCAAIAAISGSDIDTTRFVFEGFIPVKGKSRTERLKAIALECRTVVLYESPHRIKKTLHDLDGVGMSNRRLTIARELTKIYEEFIRTTVSDALLFYETTPPKGEIVLVLEGSVEYSKRTVEQSESFDTDDLDIDKLIESLSGSTLSMKEKAAIIAEKFSISKKDAYARVQRMKDLKKNTL